MIEKRFKTNLNESIDKLINLFSIAFGYKNISDNKIVTKLSQKGSPL